MPEKTYHCYMCNGEITDRTAYKSNSAIHSIDGRMAVCKKCLNSQFKFLANKYHNHKQAVKRICMMFDVYYNEAVYEGCIDKDGSVSISRYLQRVNSAHKGKTFEDSLVDGFSFDGDAKGISVGLKKEKGDPFVEDTVVQRWGSGFSYKEYESLETHYAMLRKSNPNLTNNQEIFVKLLCKLNNGMDKALDANDFDTFSKASAQYTKMFKDAGLQVVQEVDMGSDDCWGAWTQIIENYTPAEYYKDKSLFKDYDKIGDYFERFVLRPLRNLMHGTTDRDSEYCVKDDDDGYTEPSK